MCILWGTDNKKGAYCYAPNPDPDDPDPDPDDPDPDPDRPDPEGSSPIVVSSVSTRSLW